MIIAAVALLAALPGGVAHAALQRPDDPVVFTGAQKPALIGADPAALVAFAWTGTAWQRVPVQVDQRTTIDLRSAYPDQFACGSVPLCFAPHATGPTLVYADPGTLVGADPDPKVDSDDEIVFMARDAGLPFAGSADPAGVVAGSRVPVEVTDPLTQARGYVYLFTAPGGLPGPDPAPYVHYAFRLTSGAYPSTYRFTGGPGGNPETSEVVTSAYWVAFTDRWQEPDLAITRPGATGVDILDRNENQFPDDCSRSDRTFSRGEGAFLTNISGPVRAIRAYLGANSGPMTEIQQVFYATREDDTVRLRVHAIGGVSSFMDYSPAAVGMRYRNNNNPLGVTVDGMPDTVVPGVLTWESMDGPQGALTGVYRRDTTLSPAQFTSYYRDDLHPAQAPCEGDGAYIGASGALTNGPIGTTDGLNPPARLTVVHTWFFDEPGGADGPRRTAEVNAPLSVETPTPSSRFTVRSAHHVPNGAVAVAVGLPGPGTLAGVLRHGSARVGATMLTVRAAGRRLLTVRLTAAGRRHAARHHGRLAVRLAITFTPTGGRPYTRTLARTARLR